MRYLFLATALLACGKDGKDGAAGPAGTNAGAIDEILVCEGALTNPSGPWKDGWTRYERARMEGGDVHVAFRLRDGAGTYYNMSAMYKAGMEGGKEGRISLATPHGLTTAYGPVENDNGTAFLIIEGGPYGLVSECSLY